MKSKGYFLSQSRQKNKISIKIFAIFFILIAIFIPTIIAIITHSMGIDSINKNDLMTVSLYKESSLIYKESGNPEKADLDTFVYIINQMISNNTEITENTPSVKERPSLKSVVEYNDTVREYTLYLSPKDNNSFFVDQNNRIFSINKDVSSFFLASPYCQFFYDNAVPPELYTNIGDVIVPTSVNWSYLDVAGKAVKTSNIETTSKDVTYNMSGAIGLSFSKEPDEYSVKIYQSGKIIHEGSYKDLSSITVEPGTNLKFEVSATWNQSDTSDSFGKIDYNFGIIVRDHSDFSVDKTNVTAGDFVVVSCTNIFNTDKISFSSVPDINYSPAFYQSGDTVYSLIPFSTDIEPGDYLLTFSYGASMKNITLTVAPCLKQDVFVEKPSSVFSADTANKKQEEFESIIDKLNFDMSIYSFIDNVFADYTNRGATVLYNYGTDFSSKNNETDHHTIQGTLFSFSEKGGAPVTALSSGVVIDTGISDYIGKYIIIEHGFGLRTVYGHLGSINVSVNDFVMKDENIGSTGKIDSMDSEGVFIMCYVFDVAVDYTQIAGTNPVLHYDQEQN